MNRLGDEFFSGTALALDQDRGAAGRDLRNQIEYTQHDFAFAHDVGEVVALLERALELQILFFGAMPRDGRADVGHELLVVPGLLDEVLRAGADGLDDVVHRPVGGDHDNRQLLLALLYLRQQFQAALPGKSQVEEDEVEILEFQDAQPLLPIRGHAHLVTFQREQHFERFADARLVVDDENTGVGWIVGISRSRQIQRRVDLRHGQNSSTTETQDGKLCRRLWRSRRGFFQRVPG